MTPVQEVHLYLYPDLQNRVAEGRDGFLAAVLAVLQEAGLATHLHGDDAAELARARSRPGYALFRMIDPPHRNGLTFRKTYLPPFFHIETHARRWDWPVARARFDPDTVNPAKAARFVANWRHRLFGDAEPRRDGFVLVPLQGRLTRQRSFQTCAPVAMLETLLATDPRPVIATLHPRERYDDADRAALSRLVARHPRLTVQTGGTQALLPGCDYVVTQNSAVALHGFFLGKPAALFAGADFHHIAANAGMLGGAEAILAAPGLQPDFAAYLWWFFRDHAIDASRPDAKQAIAAALRRAGWPIP